MKKQLLVLGVLSFQMSAMQAQSFNWVRPFGGVDADEGYCVSPVGNGGSYVTGMFNGTAQFGGTSLTSVGGKDMFVARLDGGGNVAWARRAGGTGDQGGHVVATDGSGNAIVAGEFQGSMDFSSGALTATGGTNLYIAKYNDAGLVLWAVQGITTNGQCNSVASDLAGNIVVTGRFEGSLQFGAQTVTSNGDKDAYVLKLTSAGTVQWLVRAGGADEDDAKGLAIGQDGSVFIAGSFNTIAQFGAITLAAPGAVREIFVAKLNSTGAFQWAKSAGGTGIDQAYEIAADHTGNCYVTGFYSGTATFGTFNVTSAGVEDAFVAKLSGTGNFLWVTSVGGADEDRAYAVEVSPWGNVYFAGSFMGTAIFGGPSFISLGDKDIFVAALNASGALTWAAQAGGLGFDRAYGITTDGIGGIWITGTFAGLANWGPHSHTSAGMADGFVARIGAPVGMEELQSGAAWSVFPNPARERIAFTLPLEAGTRVELRLLDGTGRCVREQRVVAGVLQEMDLSTLPSGLYLLHAPGLGAVRVVRE